MFTLDQLEGFVAVATELHFGRAAERLNMTQPPLTRQIQKLEQTLGVSLLDRNKRNVSLTPAGLTFLAESRRLLALAREAPERARRAARDSGARIDLGFTALAAFEVLRSLLANFDQAAPDIEIRLHEMSSKSQTQGLLEGALDVGFVRLSNAPAEFESKEIQREPLLLVAPIGHSLALESGAVDVADLEDTDFLMYPPLDAKYFHDLTARVLGATRPSSMQYITNVHTMAALARADRGVAIVPASTREMGVDGVVYRPIKGWETDVVQMHAIWLKDSVNPTLKRFVKILSAAFSLNASGHDD